jgi:hypothetical protein
MFRIGTTIFKLLCVGALMWTGSVGLGPPWFAGLGLGILLVTVSEMPYSAYLKWRQQRR